jgi:hypothetical protein
MATIKQTVSQAAFSHQYGRRQSTAASQVDRFLTHKAQQLAQLSPDTLHPLLQDKPIK